jgi:hypothetical protein
MREFLTIITIAVSLFLVGFTIDTHRMAQAAPPAPPTVAQCDQIATAGVIAIYRCIPETGPSFLVNSIGFMTPEE